MTVSLAQKNSPFSQRPILWNENIIAADSLNEYFQIGCQGSEIEPGHHIIALENELLIRQLARKLQEVEGTSVDIYQLTQSLDSLVAWGRIKAVSMISMGALPYETWLKSLKDKPLELEDAVAIAEHIIKCDPDSPQRNIDLDVLGRRAGVSEYNWDKKHLASIRKKLEQTFALSSSKTNDTKERLKLDVLALLKESDPVAYEVMRADIQSRYRLNGKGLERIIRSLSHQTKEAEVEDLGLDELFDLPCDNVEYVIPGMLPVGEAALLIANPKAGKSLLAYDAAFAVATGEDTFLGERCKQGKVLIVQCDESTGTAKGRLLKRGFRREDAPNVRFMHKFSITQLGALESKLETFRPTLVIIDSLRRINAGREVSENSAEFADNIYQLKELCAQYSAALLLIHHSNKNSEAVGVEKVRGSSAIAGATWGIWDLTQIPKPDPDNKKKLIIDPKDPTRILSIIARDVEGQRLQIELDPENNHWLNHGQQGISSEEVKEQKTHSAKVVELLESVAPVGLEASEINHRLGIGRGIYSILNRLLGQKVIGSRPSDKDRRRTVYFCSTVTHQPPDNPPPPTVTVPTVIEYAEPIDISTIQSSITFDHNSITFDHNPLADEWKEQDSNPEPENDTAYSITPAHSEGGRGAVPLELSQPERVEKAIAPLGEEPLQQTGLTITRRSDGGFEVESPSWLDDENLQSMAELLTECEDAEQYDLLRQCWNSQGITAACKFGVANDLISHQKYAQLMQWEPNLIEPNHG